MVEKYDKNKVVSFQAGTAELYHANQWFHFQASGQGPYFGQAVWFKIHHQEQLQSAVDRYINEIRGVSGVLNGVLQDRKYLVSDAYCLLLISWRLVDVFCFEEVARTTPYM